MAAGINAISSSLRLAPTSSVMRRAVDVKAQPLCHSGLTGLRKIVRDFLRIRYRLPYDYLLIAVAAGYLWTAWNFNQA